MVKNRVNMKKGVQETGHPLFQKEKKMKHMKSYGFKLSDGKVTFTRWFSSYGTTDGIPVGHLDDIIRAQHCRVYHQAHAYCKAAAHKYGLNFQTLTEKDWRENKNPIIAFIHKLIKGGKKK